MIYLIQGFMFFGRTRFGIGYDASGARVSMYESLTRSMFSGVIGPEQDDPTILVGRVIDDYGTSVLRGILIAEDVFNFVKLYDHRTDHIDYTFKKIADGTWQGNFTGKATGTGQARCILTPVSEVFFLPKQTRPVRRDGPRGDSFKRYRR